MTWSLGLLGALLLLFPGLSFFAGMLAGSKHDRLSPLPERPPNSLTALLIVLSGALLGHILGSLLFLLQSLHCGARGVCFKLQFDPNPYKAALSGNDVLASSDASIFFVLFGTVFLGCMTAIVGFFMATQPKIQQLLRPEAGGWLQRIGDEAADDTKIVTAYVLTKLNHNGYYAGYEGAVEHIGRDANGQITSIVLAKVDRFSVRMSSTGLVRDGGGKDAMEYLSIPLAEMHNVSFDVLPTASLAQA